ncbi:MAG: hypothetical protein A2808_01825 [Candidatus Moranbacteria bacterium RIFCSPHIGHO2_01_FULL_55_24]|nr:MAG: hypothetical protein A2808_01825 [Candidatus Moranbacteria bacterium RIFCSPHIGHO2_01_FULL_55_24]
MILLLLLLLAGGVFAFWRMRSGSAPAAPENSNVPLSPSNPPSEQAAPPVTNEVQSDLFGSANYESESFKVGEIAIGGESELLLSEDSPEPLEITSIRGEAFTEKNKPEVKLVLTWKTNKLSRSEIQYAKGVGQAAESLEEDDYSFNHSVLIPGLDPASTYIYTILSRDRFGNEISSDSHAVYTGSKTVSLFDLIADAVGEVFGWAIKKN